MRWVGLVGVICASVRVVAAEPSTEVAAGIVVPLGDLNANQEWPLGYELAARQELPYSAGQAVVGAEYTTWNRGESWRAHRIAALAGKVWRRRTSPVPLTLRIASGPEVVWSSKPDATWIPKPDGSPNIYTLHEWTIGVPVEAAARVAFRVGPLELGIEAGLVVSVRLPERTSNDGPPDTVRGPAAAVDLSLTIRLRE